MFDVEVFLEPFQNTNEITMSVVLKKRGGHVPQLDVDLRISWIMAKL